MPRSIAAVLTGLLLLLSAVAAPVATAQQRGVAWDHYDVDLAVQPDASLAVAETQTIQFQGGPYQQGFRVVPTDRTTGIDGVSVAEVAGGQTVAYRESTSQAANTFRTSNTDQGLRIDWTFAPTSNAARTFVVRYVAHGAVRIYDAGDQAQWKAIYADRPGPVSASSVTVHLPADVDPSSLITSYSRYTTRSSQYALPSNGTGQAVDARTVRFDTGALDSGVGIETRVQFPHGIVSASPPPWQAAADRADWVQQSLAPIGNFLALLVALAVLAMGGLALFLVWFTQGRDPSPGVVPAVLEEPPSNLPAPLAGTSCGSPLRNSGRFLFIPMR